MKTKITQKTWVKAQLAKHGKITRNQCLARYISRLGAIIADLKDEGYRFEAYYQKTKRGTDYVYKLAD